MTLRCVSNYLCFNKTSSFILKYLNEKLKQTSSTNTNNLLAIGTSFLNITVKNESFEMEEENAELFMDLLANVVSLVSLVSFFDEKICGCLVRFLIGIGTYCVNNSGQLELMQALILSNDGFVRVLNELKRKDSLKRISEELSRVLQLE